MQTTTTTSTQQVTTTTTQQAVTTTTSTTDSGNGVECPNGSNTVLTIVTDDYPDETTWEIKKDGSVVASGGPYNDASTTYSESFCFAPGSYQLDMYDSFGDGVCCAEGDGSYTLAVVGMQPIEGGNFGSSTSETFEISGPVVTTPQTTTSSTTTTTEPDKCPGGEEFKLTLKLDGYPGETSWEIVQNGATVMSGGNYPGVADFKSQLSEYTEVFCLTNGQYTFVIKDSYGDGICCSFGNGSFEIELDGVSMNNGPYSGNFGAETSIPFTVG